MQNNHPYKVLLFDIGGVLVELTGIPRMMELTHHRFTVSELWERWILSPVIRAFESGNMSVDEFGPRIIEEFNIALSPEQYLAEFTCWPAGLFPGAVALLLDAKKHATIASLSNTNELHWNRILTNMGIIHHFDENFPSHLTTRLKPDVATYTATALALGVHPEEVLFLDDNIVNVDGAKKAGMDAAVVYGVTETRAYLEKIGVL